jgi:cytochrome c oxidase cbb3-type subunit 4
MDFDTLYRFSKEFSLIWFFLLFIGVLGWVYWPGRKKGYEEAGRMALDDDEPSPPKSS